MNDRYLFRAKRIYNGEWVEGYLVETRHNTYFDGYRIIDKDGINYDELDYYEPSFMSYVIDKDTICQYTGLTDKNGQKIWENDVIRGYLDDSYPEDATYAEVIFWKSGFYTREKRSNDVHKIDYYTEQNYEIVGNIFDNPELLSE